MDKIDYHDSEITKIEYRPTIKELVLLVELYNNQYYELSFKDVEGWELSPFHPQNVLFDINIYDSITLTDWVIDNYYIHEYYVNLVKEKEYMVFVLDASAGMGGHIVAKEMATTKIN